MKTELNTAIIFCILMSLIWSITSFEFSNSQKENSKSTKPKDKLEANHEPSEEFFLQRIGPDGEFAIDAYTTALQQINNQVQTRNNSGFQKEWTVQGPGNIGARINTIAVHPTDENTIYAGFSDGGIFKTTDGGITWNPIFDSQPFLSIGDIVIDPNDPNILYVGTGDPNISGTPSIGDGIYRSEDGGASWTNIGLEETRIISKIILDPTSSNNIFAATMGLPFVRTNDRGLYRSSDNGITWEQILFVSDSTGIVDMVMHPNDPQTIYAVGWDRIRNNSESLGVGIGAKVYKTTDGGNTWEILEGGLPNDEPHSRMGIAISPSNPDILYAEYVGKDFQLENIYRTNDAGMNWDTIPTDEDTNGLSSNSLGGFGWYFGKIRVNPTDPDDIYLLGVELWRSKNAGELWEKAAPDWWTYDVHADKHDLAFLNDGGILLATDGGLYKSDADNLFWEDMENIPTTQFYRVAYNPHNPDFYYGGAQDNGSTGGNETLINSWSRIYGGDGFQMVFDPDNSERFFVETQNGRIRVTLDGGGFYDLAIGGIDPDDRRNWDMPYIMSPHWSQVLYTGTYRVYQGFGDIPNWFPISDDLTDGPGGFSRNRTITAIDESVLEEGLLYVGTGDGNVWRGEDTGNTWTSISNGLPDQYVTDVVASPSDVNVVFATFSGYRDNDFLPRIHRSSDQGNTWKNISNNLPDVSINELLVVPETGDSILFVATDGGVYGSITAGAEWERLGTNMPIIPVFDLDINEVKNELVAGTFARSIMSYSLDSISNVVDPPVNIVSPTLLENQNIQINPTLAQHFIQVKFNNNEPNKMADLVILNMEGKVMLRNENLEGKTIDENIDVSNYPTGQYIIKAKIRHQIITGKFVKI